MGIAETMRRSRLAVITTGMALSLWGLALGQAEARRVVLPSGTVVPVKLDVPLSSKTSQPGDKFTATVVNGSEDAGLPDGTTVEGVVREAQPSENNKPGVLDVDFRRMVFPNGTTRTVDATIYSLDSKSVKRGSDGRLIATNNKAKDRLKFVGIGAGAGLVIAALTKGNTILDTVLGAGLGYLYNEYANNKVGDVNLNSGTKFGMRLDKQFAFDTSYGGTQSASSVPLGGQYYRGRSTNSSVVRPAAPSRLPAEDYTSGEDMGMLVNDTNVTWDSDARPYMLNGTPMVPIDAVSRAASFPFKYDARTRTIYADNNRLRLAVGSRIAVRNGVRHRLPVPAQIRSGHLYVPMQFVSLATGGTAYWDAPSRTVVLTTDNTP